MTHIYSEFFPLKMVDLSIVFWQFTRGYLQSSPHHWTSHRSCRGRPFPRRFFLGLTGLTGKPHERHLQWLSSATSLFWNRRNSSIYRCAHRWKRCLCDQNRPDQALHWDLTNKKHVSSTERSEYWISIEDRAVGIHWAYPISTVETLWRHRGPWLKCGLTYQEWTVTTRSSSGSVGWTHRSCDGRWHFLKWRT